MHINKLIKSFYIINSCIACLPCIVYSFMQATSGFRRPNFSFQFLKPETSSHDSTPTKMWSILIRFLMTRIYVFNLFTSTIKSRRAILNT